jgi:hypothetical protein
VSARLGGREKWCRSFGVLLLAGLSVSLSIPATAHAASDASCPGPPNNSVAFGGQVRLAQTFTAVNSGLLTRAHLEIVKEGTPGNWIVSINTVDGTGRPTNTVLATTTIPDATVPSGDSSLIADFATSAAVAAGQRYAVVLTRPGSDSVAMRYRNDNPCAGAFASSPTQTGSFGPPSAVQDMMFAVFVEPDCDSDGFGDETQDPDTSLCNPPLTKADGTLTIDANKGKVEKGRKVLLSGQLDVAANESCEQNRQIQIQRRLKSEDDSKFATFQTVQTDATGNYSLKVKVKKTYFYRAVVAETDACDDETSNAQKVRVQKKKAAQEA